MATIDTREAHWAALTATVARLEAKVETLERARRTDRVRSFFGLMVGIAGSFVVAFSISARAQAPAVPVSPPGTLVCKDLQVVGDDHKIRARIFNSPNTNCGVVETYNATGVRLIALSSTPDTKHDGAIGTFSASGKLLTTLTTDSNAGNGVIGVYDKDGNYKKALP